jgi:hypothetical protein
MAFGIEVYTSKGVTTLDDAAAARLVGKVEIRAVSGSASVPDFNSNTGFFFIHNMAQMPWTPIITWNNSTKILSWSASPEATQNKNVDVFFFQEA